MAASIVVVAASGTSAGSRDGRGIVRIIIKSRRAPARARLRTAVRVIAAVTAATVLGSRPLALLRDVVLNPMATVDNKQVPAQGPALYLQKLPVDSVILIIDKLALSESWAPLHIQTAYPNQVVMPT